MEELSLAVEGTRVHGVYHGPRRPKRVAILLHGFVSCMQEFGDLPERLAEAGMGCLAIDMRGHGLSSGERGRVGLGRAMADVDAALEWLDARAPRAKRFLVGHSLGGALALGIAARRGTFSGLVVAHPVDRLFDEVPAWKRLPFHAMGRLARRRMGRGRPAGMVPQRTRYRDLFVSKAALRTAREAPFLQQEVNLANYTFATTMQASAWAAQVTCPVLCIGSDVDVHVDPAHSQAVFDAIAGPVQALRHQGGHSCFRDLDRDLVTHGIIKFMESH